jgi:cell division protein FtsB
MPLRKETSSNRSILAGQPTNKRRGAVLGSIHWMRLLAGALVVLNILLFYGICISPNGAVGYRRQRGMVAEMEEKVKKLKTENQRAFESIEDLKKDPEVQEKMVRRQLGWAKEGELVVDFLPSEPAKNN